MRQTDAIIIGAGQAGLAMSHCLSRSSIDHVVLERGQLAQRWRDERWDSLRLLTPNWMSRLPGWSYQGTDPDGFMTMPEVTSYLENYGHASKAPAITDAAVSSVRRVPGAYRVESSRGTWHARCVVIATGQCDTPFIPDMARDAPPSVWQMTPSDYRSSGELPKGHVLIVGASASGVQLAAELQQSGRQVTIAVGRHTRLPRLYRGRDIMWWMDRIGLLTVRAEQVSDLRHARAQPSMQLVGRPDRSDLDLGILRGMGVQVVGRAAGIRDGTLYLQDDLMETVPAAQRKLERLLSRIDQTADVMDAPSESWPADLAMPESSPATLRLNGRGIDTIIWATGFRRNYTWLQVPILDSTGEIIHAGGVTPSPGLYVLGLRFLRRRNSNFLDGVGADAADLSAEVRRYLSGMVCAAA
jgi:putative flavoprotein involved in K+ transport